MEKNNNDIDKMIESVESISSARECTGLVARGPIDDEEYNNYMNLMKFSPNNIQTEDKKH